MKSLLEQLLADCVTMMRSGSAAPETRMFAQVMARNIITAEGGDNGALGDVPEAWRRLTFGKLEIEGPGSVPGADVFGL